MTSHDLLSRLDPPTATPSPKRKRNSIPPTPPSSSPSNHKIKLDTNIMLPKGEEEANAGSPRTKVANDFQGLQIEDGAVSKLDLKRTKTVAEENLGGQINGAYDDGESITRKKAKVMEIPETPDIHEKTKTKNPPFKQPFHGQPFTTTLGSKQNPAKTAHGNDGIPEVDPVMFKSGSPLGKLKGGGLKRAYPSINRLSDSKSRARKRSGTPPLKSSKSTDPDGEELPIIVDPERAAQTWHDDEITGHDPSDPEDDGEGINGIGFKPTPAEAYARAQKRKSQMAEYKTREAREARARRGERRRGEGKVEQEEARERERRVRFMEGDQMEVMPAIG